MKNKINFLKKHKMLDDIVNCVPKGIENHETFLKYKDEPYKQIVNYKVNDDNFIGDNFVYNPDILALGCSVTLPAGIPHGLSWPHLIKDELDSSLNVLAYSGGSIQKITFNATRHILKYGIPKKIYFLLPSFDRAWMTKKSNDPTLPKLSYDYLSSKNLYQIKQHNYYELANFFYIDFLQEYSFTFFMEKIKPSKDFLGIKRSVSLEYGFQNELLSLINFFSFCKILKIESFCYSWNPYFDELLFNNQDMFFDIFNFSPIISQDSYWKHGEEEIFFKPEYFSNNVNHKQFWEKGLDKPESNAHPGMYTHIHFAERFIGRRLSQKTIDNAKC